MGIGKKNGRKSGCWSPLENLMPAAEVAEITVMGSCWITAERPLDNRWVAGGVGGLAMGS